jgi:hypothetical protein
MRTFCRLLGVLVEIGLAGGVVRNMYFQIFDLKLPRWEQPNLELCSPARERGQVRLHCKPGPFRETLQSGRIFTVVGYKQRC